MLPMFLALKVKNTLTNSNLTNQYYLNNFLSIFRDVVIEANALASDSSDDETEIKDYEPKRLFELTQFSFCKIIINLVRWQINENTSNVS